jgi:hypothetical protein
MKIEWLCFCAVTVKRRGQRLLSPTPMNRLLSFFKRRLSRPTSASFFSTNSPQLSPQLALNLQPDMPPAVHPPSSETFGNFDLINRVKPGFSEITVSSWRSRVTGLNVVHLDYEGERIAAAVSLPSPYVHRLYSANSSYREWLFCSGHREYAIFTSAHSRSVLQ